MTASTVRDNLRLLIQLRWIAVVGQIVTIAVVHAGLGVRLPLAAMGVLVALLAAFNLTSLWRSRRRSAVTAGELLIALLVDVMVLTLQLFASGGADNPFVFLYLLQVGLAAALLDAGRAWIVVATTAACFAGLVVVQRPLAWPAQLPAGLDQADLHRIGLLVSFALNSVLLLVFVTRISRNNRSRDALLAQARQREAEAEHILRMGLLASGAAHELGTPLSTVAVILGDWRRMPAIAGEPGLLDDIDEMQAQVARCKTIVSGILMSAGEARSEALERTTVSAFLADRVAHWQRTRAPATVTLHDRTGPPLAIASDTALRQMLDNILDNAHEASPQAVVLEADRDRDTLVLAVSDRGPGFAADMLARLGTPYRSTKNRPGSGLGLFLAVNVARTLGGRIDAANRPDGGAVVTMRLPLSAIMVPAAP